MRGAADGTPGPAASTGHAAPVGHAAMRSANLSLLLRHLHARGGRSRATLAQETGLQGLGDLADW